MTLTELDEKARADYDARYPHGWRISYEPGGIVIRFVMPRPEPEKRLTIAAGAAGEIVEEGG